MIQKYVLTREKDGALNKKNLPQLIDCTSNNWEGLIKLNYVQSTFRLD